MRTLIVCQKRNWSADRLTNYLIKYSPSDFQFIKAYKNEPETIKEGLRRKPDVVWLWGASNLSAIRKGDIGDAKLLVQIQNMAKRDKWQLLATKEADLVTCPNQAIYREYQSYGANVHLCYHGIDTTIFYSNPIKHDEFTACYTSDLSRKRDHKKGFHSCIKPTCEEMGVRLLTHQGRWLPHEEIARLYNSSDIYICASSEECFSLPAVEAATCGVIPVTTPVGIFRPDEGFFRDSYNAIIVERDVEGVKEGIKRVMDMSDRERRLMGRRAREVALHFNWERAIWWHIGAIEETFK